MAYNLPSLQKIGLDKIGPESPYITEGTAGITTFRLEDSGGGLWDLTVNTSGALVTTAVVVVTEYLLLEDGFFILLESGDKLIME